MKDPLGLLPMPGPEVDLTGARRARTGRRLSFLRKRLGHAFAVRQIQLPPGAERASDAAEWLDALVIVERGAVELECAGGTRRTFVAGDVLCLSRLPLRALRNSGRAPAVLSVVARR